MFAAASFRYIAQYLTIFCLFSQVLGTVRNTLLVIVGIVFLGEASYRFLYHFVLNLLVDT